MESQDEPLLQSWIRLSAEDFWGLVIRVRNWLNDHAEDICFWSAALLIAMLYCFEIVILARYQRSYPQWK